MNAHKLDRALVICALYVLRKHGSTFLEHVCVLLVETLCFSFLKILCSLFSTWVSLVSLYDITAPPEALSMAYGESSDI